MKWMWMRSWRASRRVVLVDELAHTNIEGSKHAKRYEDVMELLDANIDVLSTMNVQHIESLMPMVQRITGIQVRETVPDWVMQRVSEIVLADLTPEALQTRMRRGDIYPLDRAERALGNFFRPGNLIALRELALQQVTRAVDRSLESYLEKEEGGKSVGVHERIAVCVSSSPAAQYLIARAARMAQRIDAELYVIYVDIGVDDNPARSALARTESYIRAQPGRADRPHRRHRRSRKRLPNSCGRSTSRRWCSADPPRLDGADICICRRSTSSCAMRLRLMSISSRRKSSEPTWQAPRVKETSWS